MIKRQKTKTTQLKPASTKQRREGKNKLHIPTEKGVWKIIQLELVVAALRGDIETYDHLSALIISGYADKTLEMCDYIIFLRGLMLSNKFQAQWKKMEKYYDSWNPNLLSEEGAWSIIHWALTGASELGDKDMFADISALLASSQKQMPDKMIAHIQRLKKTMVHNSGPKTVFRWEATNDNPKGSLEISINQNKK